ncbi:MAG: DUF1858 domain-containing protein [Candidatus Limivicinus sp.]
MKRMGIDADMYLTEAVELYPQSLRMFMQLGMCCINEENQNWTVGELCSHYRVDTDSFIDAVNQII